MRTYAFIDAANLFYGGEKSLGWKIDYQKLLQYLQKKYGAEKVFYFGGVELYGFSHDYQKEDAVNLASLEKHLLSLIVNKGVQSNINNLAPANKSFKRVRFYRHLEQSGFTLLIKPVKSYRQEDGTAYRKANCDVDMAVRIIEEKDNLDRALILSGDSDFLPVLKYLRRAGKQVVVLSRAARTAKEIRQFVAGGFRGFEHLERHLKFIEK